MTSAPQRASSKALSRPRPVPPPVISTAVPARASCAKIRDRGSLMASDHRSRPVRASAAVAVRPLTALGFARVPQTVGLRSWAHRRRLPAVELVAERQPRRTRSRVGPDACRRSRSSRSGSSRSAPCGSLATLASGRGRARASAQARRRLLEACAAPCAGARRAERRRRPAKSPRESPPEQRPLRVAGRRQAMSPRRRRLFSRRRRLPWAIAGILVLVLGGVALGVYLYERNRTGQHLPPARAVHRRIDAHRPAETPTGPLLLAELRLHEGPLALLPRPRKRAPAVPPALGAQRPRTARVPAGDLRGPALPARRQRAS